MRSVSRSRSLGWSSDSDDADEAITLEPERPVTFPKKMPISFAFIKLGILNMVMPAIEARNKHGAELFAGVKSIYHMMNGMNMLFQSFEYDDAHNGSQDLCFWLGFLNATRVILETMPHGFVWAAVVCSTWVFVSKSSTGRHINNMGFNIPCCQYANNMVQRVCMLLELCTALSIYWIVEQPKSSTMHLHDRWEYMHDLHEQCGTPIHTSMTSMGAFDGESKKDLKLKGTAPFLNQLSAQAPRDAKYPERDIVRRSETADGRIQVTGGSDLKSTQAYTREFGLATAHAYYKFCKKYGTPQPQPPVKLHEFEAQMDTAAADEAVLLRDPERPQSAK